MLKSKFVRVFPATLIVTVSSFIRRSINMLNSRARTVTEERERERFMTQQHVECLMRLAHHPTIAAIAAAAAAASVIL